MYINFDYNMLCYAMMTVRSNFNQDGMRVDT